MSTTTTTEATEVSATVIEDGVVTATVSPTYTNVHVAPGNIGCLLHLSNGGGIFRTPEESATICADTGTLTVDLGGGTTLYMDASTARELAAFLTATADAAEATAATLCCGSTHTNKEHQ